MRSLLVTINFPPESGGVQNYLYNIIRFSKSKFIVLTQKRGRNEVFDKKQKFKIYRADIFREGKPKRISMFLEALKIIRKENIDLIQAGQVLPTGLIGALLKIFTGKALVIYTHGLDVLAPQRNPIRKFFLLFTLKRANKIFANSDFTRERLLELGISKENIFKLTPGVDLKEFFVDFNLEEFKKKTSLVNSKIILSIGRLVERKGFDFVIKALPAVLRQQPNSLYLIIGEGPYRLELERLIKENSLQKKVKLLGWLERGEIIKYLNLCDVFVMPSRLIEKKGEVEGFGIVFLEAGACKKPVIGSKSGGIKNAVVDGKTGLLVNDPTSMNEITSKIIQILKNKKFAEELGNYGWVRVKEEFRWEDVASKMDGVLSSLQK